MKRNIDLLQGERRNPLQHWQLYPMLEQHGLWSKGKLSDKGGWAYINGVNVRVMSKEHAQLIARCRKNRFVHRVFVDCDCGQQIPFGRICQHKCK